MTEMTIEFLNPFGEPVIQLPLPPTNDRKQVESMTKQIEDLANILKVENRMKVASVRVTTRETQ
jgi:hypothetical protein